MANRPSRLVVPIYAPSFDGRFYGRWPKGDKPGVGAVLGANAVASSAATAAITTAIRMQAAAQARVAAVAGLSTGIQLAGTSNVRAAATAALQGTPDFTPFYVGKFDVGTIGAAANTEYVNFNAGSNAIVYANDYTGPFGETKIGKVQLTATQSSGEYFYGGSPRLAQAIPCLTGNEFWGRAYFLWPTNWCNGGLGSPPYGEPVFGAIKFLRLFFDTDYRLTLLLGRDDGGSGAFLSGSCASTSISPVLGFANSEIGSTNSYASSYIPLTRDTWWAIQWYVKFGTAGGSDGIFRAWVNDTRVINATNVKTRPPTAPSTVASGFACPGDLINGGPGNNNPFFVANMVFATHLSPPTTVDSFGTKYIPSTTNALDF